MLLTLRFDAFRHPEYASPDLSAENSFPTLDQARQPTLARLEFLRMSVCTSRAPLPLIVRIHTENTLRQAAPFWVAPVFGTATWESCLKSFSPVHARPVQPASRITLIAQKSQARSPITSSSTGRRFLRPAPRSSDRRPVLSDWTAQTLTRPSMPIDPHPFDRPQ